MQVYDRVIVGQFDVSGYTKLCERLDRQAQVGAEAIRDIVDIYIDAFVQSVTAVDGEVVQLAGDAILSLFPTSAAAMESMRLAAACLGGLGTTAFGVHPPKFRAGFGSGRLLRFDLDRTQPLIVGSAANESHRTQSAARPGSCRGNRAFAASLPSGAARTVPGTSDVVWRPPTSTPNRTKAATVATPLTDGHHRVVSCAFVRLDHLDSIDDPSELEAFVEIAEELVSRVCDDHRVTWLQTDSVPGGASLMITSGFPEGRTHPDRRLMEATHEIVRGLGRRSPARVSAGLAGGRAFGAQVGSSDGAGAVVFGDVVNTAARLAAAAGPDELVVEGSTAGRARVQGSVSEPLVLKGKSKPVTIRRVAAAEPLTVTSVERPIVPRPEITEQLDAALAEATDGAFSATVLTGRAGCGKSTILEGWVAAQTHLTAVQLVCREHRRLESFDVWRQLVGDALDAALAPISGSTTVETSAHVRAVVLVADLVEATARRSRLLIIEDVHWMDPSSRAVLDELLARTTPEVGLVMTSRDWDDESSADSTVHVLGVDDLDDERCRQLVRSVIDDPFDVERVDAVVETSAGNPFYAVELARFHDPVGGDLPLSIAAMVSERIDALEPFEQTVIETLAAAGASLPEAVIAELFPDAADTIAQLLDGDLDLIERRDDQVVFWHDLVRDGAYRRMPSRRRRAAHERVFAALNRLPDPTAVAAQLAVQAEQAARWPECAKWAEIAGHRAAADHATAEAAEQFLRATRAEEHLDAAGGKRRIAELAEAAGDMLSIQCDGEQARRAYRTALTESGHPTRVMRKISITHRHQESPRWAMRWINKARASIDGPVLAHPEGPSLLVDLASIHHHRGRFEVGRRLAEQVLEVEALPNLVIARAQLLYDWCSVDQGGAARYGDEPLERFRRAGDVAGLVEALLGLGVSLHLNDHLDEALGYYAQVFDVAPEVGDRTSLGLAKMNTAEILMERGRPDDAEQLLQEARRLLVRTDYRAGVVDIDANLARLMIRRGDIEAGLTALRRSVDRFSELESAFASTATGWIADEIDGLAETRPPAVIDDLRARYMA